jgi:N-acetyl-anhydromuramyl-L-alanine amidase AmpD
MVYQLLEQYTAKNFTPGPRDVTAITIHWWGNPVGQTFEGIVDWFCNPRSSVTTSAHYVAEAGRVACIVSPDDIAWHAGDWGANVANIGIECNPRATDADYQTIGELVAYLRGLYGDLPLYPHRHWTQTTCPGVYDIARIDAIARGADVKPQAATGPAPIPAEPAYLIPGLDIPLP